MNLKKLLIKSVLVSLLLCFFISSFAFASDFIAPNSSGEPIAIDVSNLNITSSIDVGIGDFHDQPRPYRDINTKTLVIFPVPAPDSEKTIEIRSGGSSISKTISFRPSPKGDLKNSLLPDLQSARGGNTVTKISDGRIVLIGGSKELVEHPISSLEIFDPETGRSALLKTPNELKNTHLQIGRSQHTATYLGISEKPIGMITGPVEQIVIAGGFSKDGALESSIEIIEIKVGTTQAVSTLLDKKKAKLKKARIFHTANLLPDGRVLIIGGQGKISMTNLGALNSIEIFDPVTKEVIPSGLTLNTPRLLHTATTLQNGNILIAGGFTNEKQGDFGSGTATDSAELLNTKNLTINKVGSLINKEGLGGHSASLLTNGLLLLFGGNSDFFSTVTKDTTRGLPKGTIQFYNPNTETFNTVTNKTTGANLTLEIPRFLHQNVLLPNGDIIIVGGLNIKTGVSTANLISTPVSTIEVFDLSSLIFNGSSVQIEQKNKIETTVGRIFPTAILITPKNKTQGFLLQKDSDTFINSAVYISGGFTNGLGKLPSKTSELLQIQPSIPVEGRNIKLNPEAILQGSSLNKLLIELDIFSKVPSLKIEPQTINLSTSNNFMASAMIISSNGDIVLLKAENQDLSNPIIVSPSLFQSGDTISISRKDNLVQGLFELNILVADSKKDFIPGTLKVNVQDSSKPFVATVPSYGISLSTQEDASSENIQVKIFSQDGTSELSSIPLDTKITASISDPTIANLGGPGISSVTGTKVTQFTVNAVKPGKTSLNFTTTFPDILPVSIPLQVSGAPTFSGTPIDSSVVGLFSQNGIEQSSIKKTTPTSVEIEDVRLSTNSSLFPIYIPINLQSSIDNSTLTGTFTIRPIFGIDLLAAIPRTLVNKSGTGFKNPLVAEPTALGGIVSKDSSKKPIAVLGTDDGLKVLEYSTNISENLSGPLSKINNISPVRDLKLFELDGGEGNITTKIVALKGAMVFLLDSESGEIETTATLSSDGFELALSKIDGQDALVVSVGNKGIDLVFPITDAEPRVVNFQLPGNTKSISIIEKLGNKSGPFVAAYDGGNTISIIDLKNINAQIETINSIEKISKMEYAGIFTVNGKTTDVLCAIAERKISLFDLNNLVAIPVTENLKIKNQIEDLKIINGIAYLALGPLGVTAISINALINKNENIKAQIARFKKNKLTIIKPNGREEIKTKPLNAKKLADSSPFLLLSGEGNNLTVIRVSP